MNISSFSYIPAFWFWQFYLPNNSLCMCHCIVKPILSYLNSSANHILLDYLIVSLINLCHWNKNHFMHYHFRFNSHTVFSHDQSSFKLYIYRIIWKVIKIQKRFYHYWCLSLFVKLGLLLHVFLCHFSTFIYIALVF